MDAQQLLDNYISSYAADSNMAPIEVSEKYANDKDFKRQADTIIVLRMEMADLLKENHQLSEIIDDLKKQIK